MFWPLVGETLLAVVALMTVFGLTQFAGQSPGESPGQSPGDSLSGSLVSPAFTAPFSTGSLPAKARYAPVARGVYSYSFKPSHSGYQLHLRKKGDNSKLVSYVSSPETVVLAGMDFQSLAKWALEKRLSNHGEDEVVKMIRESLMS